MIISGKLLQKERNNWTLVNNAYCVLVFALLHKYKIISDEKLKGVYSVIRKDKFLRNIHTYKCDITGRWYNDEPIAEVVLHLVTEYNLEDKYMDIQDFLWYLNLFLNKNKNYCINYIYLEYFKPKLKDLSEWNINQVQQLINSLVTPNIFIKEYSRPINYYYDWDDCCCFDSYNYEKDDHYRNESKRIRKELLNEFNKLKKGMWWKSSYQIEI